MNQWIESNEIKLYLYGKLTTVQEISNDANMLSLSRPNSSLLLSQSSYYY